MTHIVREHTRLHDMDNALDHNSPGGTEDNIVVFDAAGYPIADGSLDAGELVDAGAVIVDHTIVRGDGGGRSVQDSGIIIDDSDNMSAIGTISSGAITSGDGTNQFKTAADGEVSLEGTARVTKYSWISVSALRAAGASAATIGVNGNGFVVASFADNLDRRVQANMKIPDDADLTQPMYICVGWSSPATSLDCDWEVIYLMTAVDDDTDQVGTTVSDEPTSSSTADGLVVSVIATFAGNSIAADTICVHIILQRKGTSILDTLGDIAEVHGISFKYTANKLGETI